MYTINDMTGEDIIVRKWLENEVWFLLHHVILWFAWSIHQAVNQLIFSQLTYKVINQFSVKFVDVVFIYAFKILHFTIYSDYSSEWNFDFVVFLISLWNCFWLICWIRNVVASCMYLLQKLSCFVFLILGKSLYLKINNVIFYQ